MTTFGEVRRWASAPLESASNSARKSSQGIVDLTDELRTMAIPASWKGGASVDAGRRLSSLSDRLDDAAAETAAVRRALLLAADSVTGLCRGVREVDTLARQWEFTVGEDGSVTDASGPVWLSPDKADDYAAERVRKRDELVDRVEQTLRQAADIDQDLAVSLAKALAGGYQADTNGDLSTAATQGDAAVSRSTLPPPHGGSPGDNAAWWDSLSDAERAAILAQHPAWIGNLDGVPFPARDRANRALIVTERQRLLADKARLEEDLADNWFGGTFTNDDAALEVVKGKLAALDAIERTLGQRGRYLCTLDMSGERAMAAIASGNPDTADHVSVFTPGLSTTVEGDIERYDLDNDRLGLAAMHALAKSGHPEQTVSMIAWLGYETPQNRDGGEKVYDLLFDDDTVVTDGAARVGAKSLASFLQGIDTSRSVDPHLTALGHSYGSLTTGLALQQNTGVDDMVVFGSPALGTTDSQDLQVTGQRYYIEAKNDFVGDLGYFGTDPSYLNDVHQAYSGATTLPDGRQLAAVEGHSEYFKERSTSQYNMAAVVAGLPDRVVLGSNWGGGDIFSWPLPWTHN